MATTRFITQVNVWGSDDREYVCVVDVRYHHDSGTWYDSDGGGSSPSSDMDWKLDYCVDEDLNKYTTLPKFVCEDDIEQAIWNHIEEEL